MDNIKKPSTINFFRSCMLVASDCVEFKGIGSAARRAIVFSHLGVVETGNYVSAHVHCEEETDEMLQAMQALWVPGGNQ